MSFSSYYYFPVSMGQHARRRKTITRSSLWGRDPITSRINNPVVSGGGFIIFNDVLLLLLIFMLFFFLRDIKLLVMTKLIDCLKYKELN